MTIDGNGGSMPLSSDRNTFVVAFMHAEVKIAVHVMCLTFSFGCKYTTAAVDSA